MNEQTGPFTLAEPPSPEALIPASWVEPWMVAAAFILGFGLLMFVLRIKKKQLPALDPIAVRQAAYTDALQSLDQMKTSSTRDAAIQASLILRKYLSIAAADPSLFETHEETLSRHEAFREFPADIRLLVTQAFSCLALLKYTDQLPESPVQEVTYKSRNLLETLHHGFKA